MIMRAHRRTVFWKRKRHLAGLAIRYTRDGSLWRRLQRKYRDWKVTSGTKSS
jgi:hypothetical protein